MPKILVIRFSSIGDIVLTSPVVRCIKQQIPGAEVHFLTKKSFVGVVENNPNIDKLFSIEKGVKEVMDQLISQDYDYIIDLHKNFRSFQVSSKLKGKTYRFNKLNFQKWLLVTFKIHLMPEVHIVERYFEGIKKLNVSNDNKGLEYFIPDKDVISLDQLPETHRNGYVAFVIGANYFTKRLPVNKIISICKKLDKPIILLGWKDDVGLGDKIWKQVGDRIYNACTKYNLNQSASIIKGANAVITHDTGLMHIASAFNKKIISVWGNTIPGFGMYPYVDKNNYSIIEVNGLKCRPCSKIGFQKCPKGHFKCMNLIDENKVIEDLKTFEGFN